MANQLSDQQLDELLSRLPGPLPAPDLAQRICLHLERARRRSLRLRLSLSALLALLGLWLLTVGLPDVRGFRLELGLPENGLLVLWESARTWLAQGGIYLAEGLQALLSTQGRLQPAGAPVFPGLASLALSALLVLDLLLPREVAE